MSEKGVLQTSSVYLASERPSWLRQNASARRIQPGRFYIRGKNSNASGSFEETATSFGFELDPRPSSKVIAERLPVLIRESVRLCAVFSKLFPFWEDSLSALGRPNISFFAFDFSIELREPEGGIFVFIVPDAALSEESRVFDDGVRDASLLPADIEPYGDTTLRDGTLVCSLFPRWIDLLRRGRFTRALLCTSIWSCTFLHTSQAKK